MAGAFGQDFDASEKFERPPLTLQMMSVILISHALLFFVNNRITFFEVTKTAFNLRSLAHNVAEGERHDSGE